MYKRHGVLPTQSLLFSCSNRLMQVLLHRNLNYLVHSANRHHFKYQPSEFPFRYHTYKRCKASKNHMHCSCYVSCSIKVKINYWNPLANTSNVGTRPVVYSEMVSRLHRLKCLTSTLFHQHRKGRKQIRIWQHLESVHEKRQNATKLFTAHRFDLIFVINTSIAMSTTLS